MALNKAGFSLVELIVVIGLLSLLMLAISSTMLMSMLSSNRIRTATKVKQSGNYAITQIQTLIRGAKTITACDSSSESISLINPDGGETTIFLESSSIASNSAYPLTPLNITTTNWDITCNPNDLEASLVEISFDLQDNKSSSTTQSPILHFATSISLRNVF